MRHPKIALAFFLTGILSHAQSAPKFEVVSIKPDDTPSGGRSVPGGGNLRFTQGKVSGTATARRIILEAYHLTDSQLSGGPGWIDSDRFAIEAKPAEPASDDQSRQMLQAMLADRFKLTARRGTKEMPVYVLTVAKGGSKLVELKPGQALPPPGRGAPGRDASSSHLIDRLDMQGFIRLLSRSPGIDRPVLDKAGLQGTYLFQLEWTSDEDFKSAIEEELGLKFESQKAPMDTLVIDHIEKPDAN